MTIDLYHNFTSPSCRSVRMLAKHLGIHFNLKLIDVLNGEQFKPSFVKINPQHMIPTIDDNGFILWESRPIMAYLVMKYAKNDSLYPKDPEKRATVEKWLYFDISTLYESVLAYFAPVVLGKLDKPSEESIAKMEANFMTLDDCLSDSKYIAGEDLTIADFSIISIVTTAKFCGFDIYKYENISAWYDRCKEILRKSGFEEINEAGAEILGDLFMKNLDE